MFDDSQISVTEIEVYSLLPSNIILLLASEEFSSLLPVSFQMAFGDPFSENHNDTQRFRLQRRGNKNFIAFLSVPSTESLVMNSKQSAKWDFNKQLKSF